MSFDPYRFSEAADRFIGRFLYWVLLVGSAVGALGMLRLLGIVP